MIWKREIERAATQLMSQLNLVKTPGQKMEPVAIRVIEKVAPIDYYVPQMVFSSKHALEGSNSPPALFAEIWVNSICIWRKNWVSPDPDKRSHNIKDYPDEVKNQLWQETMMEMNMFALWNNYKFTMSIHQDENRQSSVVPLVRKENENSKE